MRFFVRSVKVILVLVLILVLVAAGGIGWLFWRAQPRYAGSVAMPDLAGAVNVYRDEHGVPHIFANSMDDAARVLGYIHADERLFQMEMQRRAGAGRLSEVLGADMLDIDKFTRTLGLYRLAEESYRTFSPDTQRFCQAYADGVNLWLETHRHALPPEFLVLGIAPEPWKPADSAVWGKLMALQLSENYRHEILRARLKDKLSPEQMKELFPPPPADAPITMMPRLTKTGEAAPRPSRALVDGDARTVLRQFARSHDPDPISSTFDKLAALTSLDHAASNEWVVAGAHTESGKPILANDPHLGLEAPILWYLARIVTPDLALEGVTVPGLPVVLLGQNEHIAWGLTTTGSDVEDLFIETVDPKNPANYITPDGSQPFETRTETIHVKGAPDVTLTVRMTRHGPVMSDIDPDMAAIAGAGKVTAFAYTGLGAHDHTAEALIRINRAQNWRQFIEALQLYETPPQNIVYADTSGHIGFIAAGLVPVRKNGKGLVPADGASGENDWTGMIPFVETPQLYDPPAGFVFNANNAIVPPDNPNFYGEDWEEAYRAQRLQQFFDTTAKHSLATSAAMQADHVSLVARQLLPYLLRAHSLGKGPLPDRVAEALGMMKNWDGTMDKDRPEPLIFEAWLYKMHQLLLMDKTGDPLKAQGPFDARAIKAVLDGGTDWCGAGGCDTFISQALDAAIELLSARDGNDPAQWRWGAEHAATLRHKFYTHIPVLKDFADIVMPSSGDLYTLDRGGSTKIDPAHPFERAHAGGYRGIYDLSDPAKSRFMIATGESGHLFSPHYRDLAEAWNNGESFTLTGTQDDFKARALPELIFAPPATR